MFDTDLFLDFFIALFALLNPLFAIPVFLGLTGEFTTGARQRTAAIAALATFLALITAALVGDQILNLFGIHVESFQIAGGVIVLIIAIGMLKGENEDKKDSVEAIESGAGAARKDIAVYPLAIPLLAGPGAFVTTIVFSSRLTTMGDFAALGAAIFAVVLLLWLAMAFATTASRFLSEIAITIATRILGILLAAVAVEMIIKGIDAHFLPLLSTG
jgi:MarC family membrane protein